METRNNAIEQLMNELTTMRSSSSSAMTSNNNKSNMAKNEDFAELLGVSSSTSSATTASLTMNATSQVGNQQMISILQHQPAHLHIHHVDVVSLFDTFAKI